MPLKRVAKKDDLSDAAGNSEDCRVTHLEISGFIITNMGVIASRYRNLETLELVNCTIEQSPKLKAWAERRRLACIMCTPGEAADTLYDTLIGMDAVKSVVRCDTGLMKITWKINASNC